MTLPSEPELAVGEVSGGSADDDLDFLLVVVEVVSRNLRVRVDVDVVQSSAVGV